MGTTVAGLDGAGAADCGTRCSRWTDTRKIGDVQPSSVVSPGSGVEVAQARFGASVLRSASMPRVPVPRVSLLRASVSGPLSPRWACDRSPRAHTSFPACRALHFHMHLRVACKRHGQAPHQEGGMRGRGCAARLVWYVCGITIRMCREIMYTRSLSRGWWPRLCVGCGGRAGVAQKKRLPACLVATPACLIAKASLSCCHCKERDRMFII